MTKFYLLIVIIALIDLFAEYIGKQWIITGTPMYLWLTVLGFGGAGFFFAHSLKYEGVAIANILWIALTAILVTLMGYFVFKEQLSITNLIGIGVVIIGVILINIR